MTSSSSIDRPTDQGSGGGTDDPPARPRSAGSDQGAEHACVVLRMSVGRRGLGGQGYSIGNHPRIAPPVTVRRCSGPAGSALYSMLPYAGCRVASAAPRRRGNAPGPAPRARRRGDGIVQRLCRQKHSRTRRSTGTAPTSRTSGIVTSLRVGREGVPWHRAEPARSILLSGWHSCTRCGSLTTRAHTHV
jgi:hypothetical protein